MPAVSKTQRRLMGIAWAVRKGDLKRSEVDQEVLDIADSKTFKDEDLLKFAKTKEEGLPNKVSDSFIQSFSEFINERNFLK